MKYELKQISYNWQVIGCVAGIAGIAALAVGCFVAFSILYALSGFAGASDGLAIFWVAGAIGLAGLTVAAIVFIILSLLIAVYNHIAVPTVGGLYVDIKLP